MVMAVFVGFTWADLWLTPDQQGQRLQRQGDFAQAAEAFQDPMRIGTAWYRAGEFEKAEQVFAQLPTAESEFNRGNCLIMLGQYEAAIARFDSALELRPNWSDAEVNREIAIARAALVARQGGDQGDQKIGADDVVFDDTQKSSGQDTVVDAPQAITERFPGGVPAGMVE